MQIAFAPDAVRAARLDRARVRGLGESLLHLSERCAPHLPHDECALRRLAAAFKAGSARPPPAAFADYYTLLSAVLDDDLPLAADCLQRLAALTPVASEAGGELSIVPLCVDALGADADRYVTLLDDNPAQPLGIAPPPAEAFVRFRDRLQCTLQLMQCTVPTLAGELQAIVHQVVVVSGDPARPLQFDGGSHYQLWGALFLNADFHPTELQMFEVLAHESAHSLLFGFCAESLLVENADDELYESPLRADARPMDGIYHATFVSARMHWALAALLRSGVLDAIQAEQAHEANRLNVANFDAGDAVVRAHARLTPLGQALLRGARAYMAQTQARARPGAPPERRAVACTR